jgi:tetratricopeptide (TPR) repeat protein
MKSQEEIYAKTIKEDPDNPLIYVNRAWWQATANNNEEAQSDFEKVVELGCSLQRIKVFFEGMLTQTEQELVESELIDRLYVEAEIDIINSMIDKNSQNPALYLKRGWQQLKLNKKGRALADFQKTIELNPSSHFIESHQFFGQIGDLLDIPEIELAESSKELRLLRILIDQFPDSSITYKSYKRRLNILLSDKQYQDALSDCAYIIDNSTKYEDKNVGSVFFNRGLIYFDKQQYELALDDFLAVKTANESLIADLEHYDFSKGRLVTVHTVFDRNYFFKFRDDQKISKIDYSVRSFIENALAYGYRCEIHRAMKKDDALAEETRIVEEEFKKASKYKTHLRYVNLCRGIFYLEFNMMELAIITFEEAINTDEKDEIECVRTVGNILTKQEKLDEAFDIFSQLIKRMTNRALNYELNCDENRKVDLYSLSNSINELGLFLEENKSFTLARRCMEFIIQISDADLLHDKANRSDIFFDIRGEKEDPIFGFLGDGEYQTRAYESLKRIDAKIYHVEDLIKTEREAIIGERNRVIASLSHSIKNLIASVLDPLEALKREQTFELQTVENAIKGTELIREMVQAMNLSYVGSFNDFVNDAKNNQGKDAMSLEDIIVQSIRYSVPLMFDGKYFNKFCRSYFPSKDELLVAKSEWEYLRGNHNNISEMTRYLNDQMLALDLALEEGSSYCIGDGYGSAMKLTILFQELLLNAVKYSSLVNKADRHILIALTSDDRKINFKVSNRYNKQSKAKSSGVGSQIIKNFSDLLNAELKIEQDEHIYSVSINFKNFWTI